MSLFDKIRQAIVGSKSEFERVLIVDGIIASDKRANDVIENQSQAVADSIPNEYPWLPNGYVKHMHKTLSDRSAREYARDLKNLCAISDISKISEDQLIAHLSSLTPASSRRRLCAVNHYAMWDYVENRGNLLAIVDKIKRRPRPTATAVCLVVLLIASTGSAGLPPWSKARKIIENCYGGIDATVTVRAGIQTEYTFDDTDNDDDADIKSIMESLYGGETRVEKGSSVHRGSTIRSESEETDVDEDSFESSIIDEESSSSTKELSENTRSSRYRYDRRNIQNTAYVGVFLTVPLYSRDTRISRLEKINSNINEIADLYRVYEMNLAMANALAKEREVARSVMFDDGQRGISAYYTLISDIEKSIASMRSAKRKIISLLERCGYVE
jgi:hypothetical protein